MSPCWRLEFPIGSYFFVQSVDPGLLYGVKRMCLSVCLSVCPFLQLNTMHGISPATNSTNMAAVPAME